MKKFLFWITSGSYFSLNANVVWTGSVQISSLSSSNQQVINLWVKRSFLPSTAMQIFQMAFISICQTYTLPNYVKQQLSLLQTSFIQIKEINTFFITESRCNCRLVSLKWWPHLWQLTPTFTFEELYKILFFPNIRPGLKHRAKGRVEKKTMSSSEKKKPEKCF